VRSRARGRPTEQESDVVMSIDGPRIAVHRVQGFDELGERKSVQGVLENAYAIGKSKFNILQRRRVSVKNVPKTQMTKWRIHRI